MLPRQQAPQSRSTGEQKTWAGLQENPNSFIAFKVNTDVNVTLFLFAPIFLFYLHNRPYLKKKKRSQGGDLSGCLESAVDVAGIVR